MSTFYHNLEKTIETCRANNYGIDNYDEARFGKYVAEKPSFVTKVKSVIKQVLGLDKFKLSAAALIKEYCSELQLLYDQINDEGKELLVSIIAYKLLGSRKVKLSVNTPGYWKALEEVKKLKKAGDVINPGYYHMLLERFNLRPLGYDIDLYFSDLGILTDFILEQYAYKDNSGSRRVEVNEGDIVLDLGGCWGDTALYFAHKAGDAGKVFSFEFIPKNIGIHQKNVSLNPHLAPRINLVKHPVSLTSDKPIYFFDHGPSSRIETESFEGYTGTTTTISIDDFVEKNALTRLDFIKMDIEGEELNALKGAESSIRKFRPKLAIAIYHSMEDFVNIPQWIIDLNLGYELYLGHYTIHAEETVIFAKLKKP